LPPDPDAARATAVIVPTHSAAEQLKRVRSGQIGSAKVGVDAPAPVFTGLRHARRVLYRASANGCPAHRRR
jgi:hypothetical protein